MFVSCLCDPSGAQVVSCELVPELTPSWSPAVIQHPLRDAGLSCPRPVHVGLLGAGLQAREHPQPARRLPCNKFPPSWIVS